MRASTECGLVLLLVGIAQPAIADWKQGFPCATSMFGQVIEVARDDEIIVSKMDGATLTSSAVAAFRVTPPAGLGTLPGSINLLSTEQLATTAARLDQDGRESLVYAYMSASGVLTVSAFDRSGGTRLHWTRPGINAERIAITAGHFTGNVQDDQIAVAYINKSTRQLDVTILNRNGQEHSRYTGPRAQGVALTTGRVMRTPGRDQVVMLVADYESRLMVYRLDIVATQVNAFEKRLSGAAGDVSSLRISAGNISGDPLDEVVVAWDNNDHDDGIGGPGAYVQLLQTDLSELQQAMRDPQKKGLKEPAIWSTADVRDLLDLDLADINGDSSQEIVLALRNSDRDLELRVLQWGNRIEQVKDWSVPTAYRTDWADLSAAAVDNLDPTPQAFVLLAGKTLHVKLGTQEVQALDNTVRYGALTVADLDGDTVIGKPAPIRDRDNCWRVTEPSLVSVVRSMPYWEKLQAKGERSTFVGRSQAESKERSTTIAHSSTTSVSLFLGGSAKIGPVQGTVKASAGTEWGSSVAQGAGTETTKSTNVVATSNQSEGSVVIAESSYDCYNYGLSKVTGAPAPYNGGVVLCEVRDTVNKQSELNTWEQEARTEQDSRGGSVFRLPSRPQWADLAQFGSITASDGEWTADLRAVQDIELVRFATRSGKPIKAEVLVRQEMSGPAMMTVAASRNAGPVGYASTKAGSNAVRGRYVVVRQTEGSTLPADDVVVEVHGRLHIEPDRYPAGLRTSGRTMELKLYDPFTRTYSWKAMRGSLEWSCVGDANCIGFQVANSLSTINVSLSNTQTSFSSEQKENSYAANVGADVELEVGLIDVGAFSAGVSAGYSRQKSAGLSQAHNQQSSWSASLEMGGSVQGFGGQSLKTPGACEYAPYPFVYRVQEQTSSNSMQSYLVLDWIINESSLNRNATNECRSEAQPDGRSLPPTPGGIKILVN